jgi:hypothetical protein
LPKDKTTSPFAVVGLPEHVGAVCGRLRQADYDEVYAVTGQDPDQVLKDSWKRSIYRWAVMRQEDVIGLFGVSPFSILGPVASPWLLGTDKMEKIKLSFVKKSVSWVAYMLSIYPVLMNWVDARNQLSIKWLKWLGFKMDTEPKPFGVMGLPFYYFEKRRG